jgi:hypothetical protein
VSKRGRCSNPNNLSNIRLVFKRMTGNFTRRAHPQRQALTFKQHR